MKSSREKLLAEIRDLQARVREKLKAFGDLELEVLKRERRGQSEKFDSREIVPTFNISWEDLNRAQAVAQTGCWRFDLEKNTLFLSEETHRIFGIPPGTPVRYETFFAIIHPEDLKDVDRQWLAALEGEPYDVEHRIVVGDLVKWVRARAELEFDAEGRLKSGFGTVQEITDRKKAEEALRQSEERLRLAQCAAHVGVWDWQAQKNEVFWTPEMEKLYGLKPGSIKIYQDWSSLVHPEDLPRVEAERNAALAKHLPFEIEFRIRRPSGEIRWIQNRGGAFYGADGSILKVYGIDADVTERKEMEEALRQSEVKLQLALKSAQAGIWEWRLKDDRDIWSEELWQLYGLEPHNNKPSYETWAQTVHPADRPAVEHKLQEAARLGTELDVEWRTYVPNGVERWILARGRPWLDANGQTSSFLGISLDITERKQAEQALQESKERLHLLANQLLTSQEQERKRLALELHDELGHALLVLKFALSDIAQKLPPQQKEVKNLLQEQQEYIRHVIEEVRRLHRDLSPGDVENLGLTRALKGLIKEFAGHLPDIEWQVNLPKLAGLFSPPVQTMLYRLVQEALTNIGKYAAPSRVSIAARKVSGHLRLVIEDDGRGFDLSEVDRDPTRGMGLAAMRERLYIVGGAIEIWSQKEQGTRLTFIIPMLGEDG